MECRGLMNLLALRPKVPKVYAEDLNLKLALLEIGQKILHSTTTQIVQLHSKDDMEDEGNRDRELEEFLKEEFKNLNVHDFLHRPSTSDVTYFLLTWVNIYPAATDEKFSAYCNEVKTKYVNLCGGDQRLGAAYAAWNLSRPFFHIPNGNFHNFGIMDILTPKTHRVKAMALECMNFFGFVNMVEEDAPFLTALEEWEERNTKKPEIDSEVQQLIRKIDEAKTRRERQRCTISAFSEAIGNLAATVATMNEEKQELETKTNRMKEELTEHEETEKVLENQIRTLLVAIEGLKEQIVESPEKAAIEIRDLTETFHQLKVAVQEAEEMLRHRKFDIGMRKEAGATLKKDMTILAQIIEAEKTLQEAQAVYKALHQQLEESVEMLNKAKLRRNEALARLEAEGSKNRALAAQIRGKIQSCNEDLAESERECAELDRLLAEDALAQSELLAEIALAEKQRDNLRGALQNLEEVVQQTHLLLSAAAENFAKRSLASTAQRQS